MQKKIICTMITTALVIESVYRLWDKRIWKQYSKKG